MIISIEIDGNKYSVYSGDMIIQACFRTGMEIPRFCFHEKLTIAGNCRMCLVEIGHPKSIKPVASCAMPVISDMKIFTNTTLIKKARESVLEFLSINHPLDCPICDQGGECDLQDETMLFGSDRGRFYENKRVVEDKECGPLIKTVMTRCIHCTRCVRFFSEIIGTEFLGTIGRGSSIEIGTFLESLIDSEISGNVIDLCPVGALTSKPYASNARPWELRSIQSIDILDSFCSSIRLDLRGSEILRVLPLTNVQTNDEWISDKTRFFYDGLKRQRIHVPFVKYDNVFLKSSWENIFGKIKNLLKFFSKSKSNFLSENQNKRFNFVSILGKLVDCETIVVLKDFMNVMGSSNFFTDIYSFNINIDFRLSYIANLSYLEKRNKNIFLDADLCFLINFNPRIELPLLNIKLRKLFLTNNLLFLCFGSTSNLNYHNLNFGNNFRDLISFIEGKNLFRRKFIESKNPLILISHSLLEREDAFLIQNLSKTLQKFIKLFSENWFGLYFIENFVGRLNCFELGFVNNIDFCDMKLFFENNIIFTFGSEVFFKSMKCLKTSFIIYFGHNGDSRAYLSDIILPCSNFIEKNSIFLNYEGFIKQCKKVVSSPGMARDDWHISVSLVLFMSNMGLEKLNLFLLNYFTNGGIVNIKLRLSNVSSIFTFVNANIIYFFHIDNVFSQVLYIKNLFIQNSYFVFHTTMTSFFDNFYMTDSISRSSQILSLCSQRLISRKHNFSLY